MADISGQQLVGILNNAPDGVSHDDVMRQLISRGHTFAGKRFDPQTLKPMGTDLASTGKAIEGTSDVGVQAMGASETIHDVLHAGAAKGEEMMTPKPGAGLPSRAVQKLGRGALKAADTVQGLVPMGAEDVLAGKALEPIAEPVMGAVGKAAGKVGSAVVNRLQPSLEAVSPEIKKAINAAMGMGIKLTPWDLTQSKTLQIIESKLRSLPVFADVFAERDRAMAVKLDTARKELLSHMPDLTGKAELGEKTRSELMAKIADIDKMEARVSTRVSEKNAAMQAKEAAEHAERWAGVVPGGSGATYDAEKRGAAVAQSNKDLERRYLQVRNTLYKNAKTKLGDPEAPVQIPGLLGAAKDITRPTMEQGAPGLVGKSSRIAKSYLKSNEASKAAIEPLDAIAQQLGFKDMAEIHGNEKLWGGFKQQSPKIAAAYEEALKGAQRTMSVEGVSKEIRRLGDMAEANRNPSGTYNETGKDFLDMQKQLKGDFRSHFAGNKEALRAYDLADAFHGNYADKFRNDTIKKLFNESPTKTFLDIAKSKDYELMKKLQEAIGPNGRTVLKRQVFDNIFGNTGMIPDTADVLTKMSEYGPALRAVLRPDEQEEFRKFALGGARGAIEAPKFIRDEFDTAIRDMVKHSPEEITKHLVVPAGGADKGNVLMAQAARKYLPKEVMDLHGRQIAENILTGVSHEEGGLRGISSRLDSYNPEYLEQFFDKKTIAGMRKVGDASQLLPGTADLKPLTKGNSLGVGAMYVTGMILRPMSVISGSGAVLMTGPELARAYLSDEGRRYITTLMAMPQNDARAAKIVSDFVRKFGTKAVSAVGGAKARAKIQDEKMVQK